MSAHAETEVTALKKYKTLFIQISTGTTRGLRELTRMNGSGQWEKPLLQAHAKNSLFPGKCAYPVARTGESRQLTRSFRAFRAHWPRAHTAPSTPAESARCEEEVKLTVTYKNQLPVIAIAAAFPGAHPWRLILLYKLVLFKSRGEEKEGG